jgi:formyl-CoA transferase
MTQGIGALGGLRVVDLSRVLGGPYATQILGDHGATVIKVEPPQGDETRTYGPPFGERYSAYYAGLNRNKTTIALDLSTAGARDILMRLLGDADVLVENFRAGTMERWGLGYEALLADRFPHLIYCRITGFGDDGPLGGLPGYDAVVQSWSGLQSVNGFPDREALRLGIPAVDLATGLNATIGILLALQERARSGRGQKIDVALYDCALSLLHPHAANWFMSGRPPRRQGNAHASIAPYDVFTTRTRPVLVGAANDGQFRKLCDELCLPDLATDPRFRSNAERVANRAALLAALAPGFAAADGEQLAARLMQAGVPAGPVLDVPDVLTHPHARHRGMVVERDGYRGLGPPVKLARTPARVRSVPAGFAADTRSLLKSLGYGEAEIETLATAGAIRLPQDERT